MKKLLIDSGTEFYVDGDSLVINEVQDVEPILDANKAIQNTGVNMRSGMRHAASIPAVVWQQWMKDFKQQCGVEFDHAGHAAREKFLKLKLNDRDNVFLRTWKGRI